MEAGTETGDWKCERILGKGSYGIVGLWQNQKTNQKLAVKKFEVHAVTPPSDRVLADLQERYRKEVSMMYNQIDNPHVVATVPVPPELILKLSEETRKEDEDKYEPVVQASISLPLLCMEFCSGGDLRHLLKRPENLNGLPEKEIRRVLAHVSDAISYLHDKNIIHRDIKPENIVIQYENPNEAVYKLSDLGFAKDLSGNDSMCSTILGTLHYLAPEIYFGKKYDKTVDYWSFGLITFEIMCGVRPFLPGESPAVWIPLVEKKDKEVIAIYRNELGQIEYAKDVPYNTHLSQLFKKCLVAWLPSMLQLDPSRRGKYVLTSDQWKSGSGDANALTRLRNMLNTRFLEIRAFSDRLVYAIGRTILVSEVQKWIARDTGISEPNQLILSSDGVRLYPQDLAIKYLQSNKDLYLLSKSGGVEIKLKIKLAKVLSEFLSPNWKASRDTAKNRVIWMSAIYFVQRQLERMETLCNACEALRLYYTSSCVDELNKLAHGIDKTWYSLCNLFELEDKLGALEARYDLPDLTLLPCVSTVEEEAKELVRVSKEFLDGRPQLLELGVLQIQQLRDFYAKVLMDYESWKAAETTGKGFTMEILVRLICQFVQHRETVINVASGNMRRILERMVAEEDLKDKVQVLLSKLNALVDQVLARRIKRQNEILSAAFPSTPVSNLNEIKSKSPVMSQSLSCLNSNDSNNHSDTVAMTQSLFVGSRRSSFSPDFTKLMEESTLIETALSNSMAQVELLLNENAELVSES